MPCCIENFLFSISAHAALVCIITCRGAGRCNAATLYKSKIVPKSRYILARGKITVFTGIIYFAHSGAGWLCSGGFVPHVLAVCGYGDNSCLPTDIACIRSDAVYGTGWIGYRVRRIIAVNPFNVGSLSRFLITNRALVDFISMSVLKGIIVLVNQYILVTCCRNLFLLFHYILSKCPFPIPVQYRLAESQLHIQQQYD